MKLEHLFMFFAGVGMFCILCVGIERILGDMDAQTKQLSSIADSLARIAPTHHERPKITSVRPQFGLPPVNDAEMAALDRKIRSGK